MAKPDAPTPAGKRLSLTRQQRESNLGAELLSLCQAVSEDGRLSAEEIASLRAWLDAHPLDEFPAIAHLRYVVQQVLADERITDDENKLLRQTAADD